MATQNVKQWNGITITEIYGSSVSDGAKVFGLNSNGPINVVDCITFSPAATAGTVTVQTSPDGGETWDDMATGGAVTASASSDPARAKPSGRGVATHIRFVMSGITGATSFTALVSQGVA